MRPGPSQKPPKTGKHLHPPVSIAADGLSVIPESRSFAGPFNSGRVVDTKDRSPAPLMATGPRIGGGPGRKSRYFPPRSRQRSLTIRTCWRRIAAGSTRPRGVGDTEAITPNEPNGDGEDRAALAGAKRTQFHIGGHPHDRDGQGRKNSYPAKRTQLANQGSCVECSGIGVASVGRMPRRGTNPITQQGRKLRRGTNPIPRLREPATARNEPNSRGAERSQWGIGPIGGVNPLLPRKAHGGADRESVPSK